MSSVNPDFLEILKNAERLLAQKISQPGDINSEQLFEAEIFLAQLKRLSEQKPKEHPITLAEKLQNETSGQRIQKNLLRLGFDAAVIFDGSSRCYLNSKSRQVKYENAAKKISDIPCGFGIKIRKLQGDKR